MISLTIRMFIKLTFNHFIHFLILFRFQVPVLPRVFAFGANLVSRVYAFAVYVVETVLRRPGLVNSTLVGMMFFFQYTLIFLLFFIFFFLSTTFSAKLRTCHVTRITYKEQKKSSLYLSSFSSDSFLSKHNNKLQLVDFVRSINEPDSWI